MCYTTSCIIWSVWYAVGSKEEMENAEGQFSESPCDLSDDDDQHAVRSDTCKKRKSKKSKYETVKFCYMYSVQ